MSSFKENLDEELNKRRKTEDKKTSATGDAQKEKKAFFSLKYFILGLSLFSTMLAGLIAWAWVNTDSTNNAIENRLPSKTAIIKMTGINFPKQQQATLTISEITEEPIKVEAEKEEKAQTSQQDIDLDSLIETSPYGNLPQINKAQNAFPHKAYRGDFTRQTEKPLLSIIITQMGLSQTKTKSIIENFPKDISFAFSPYAENIKTLSASAKKDNHEIWLSLPLETKSYPLNDPGPSTLLVNTSTEKNQDRLYRTLSSTSGYVGVINNPNHAFRREDTNVNAAIKNIFERGLAFIDSNIYSNSFIYSLANSNDYPYAQNNLWLDNDLSKNSIKQKIGQIAERGAQKKNTILMLKPYPTSLKAVQKFLNSNAAKQFELAPASAQLKNG